MKVKNNSIVSRVWCGQEIAAGAEYTIENIELSRWQNDEVVLTSILTASLSCINGTTELTGVAAINALKEIKPVDLAGNPVQRPTPFALKIVEGHKLFRRKHGSGMVACAAGATTAIEFTVPYSKCKIDKVDLVGCGLGDEVSLKVKDTAAGLISGVPGYVLNQFGFNVLVSDGHFEDKSDYDADLIGGMVILVEYKNNGASARNVGCNFTLHQMVPL